MGVGAVRTESGAESSPSRGRWGRPEREATSLAVSGAPHPGRLGPQSPEGTWRVAVTGGHRPGPDLSPRLWLSFHLLQPQFPFLPTGMTLPGPEGPSVGPPVSPGRGPCVCLAPARISTAAAGEPCRGPHRPRRVVWPAAGRWVRGQWGAQDRLHGSVCSRSLGRRRGGTGSPPPQARQRLQGVARLPCSALPGEVMGKTCADALPRPRIPRATHGLSVAPPSYREGSPSPGPRVPAQPLAPGLPPSPVRNQLGARFRVQTPHLGLSIAVALICWAFKSLPPLGVGFRKAVPQAPGA